MARAFRLREMLAQVRSYDARAYSKSKVCDPIRKAKHHRGALCKAKHCGQRSVPYRHAPLDHHMIIYDHYGMIYYDIYDNYI